MRSAVVGPAGIYNSPRELYDVNGAVCYSSPQIYPHSKEKTNGTLDQCLRRRGRPGARDRPLPQGHRRPIVRVRGRGRVGPTAPGARAARLPHERHPAHLYRHTSAGVCAGASRFQGSRANGPRALGLAHVCQLRYSAFSSRALRWLRNDGPADPRERRTAYTPGSSFRTTSKRDAGRRSSKAIGPTWRFGFGQAHVGQLGAAKRPCPRRVRRAA